MFLFGAFTPVWLLDGVIRYPDLPKTIPFLHCAAILATVLTLFAWLGVRDAARFALLWQQGFGVSFVQLGIVCGVTALLTPCFIPNVGAAHVFLLSLPTAYIALKIIAP